MNDTIKSVTLSAYEQACSQCIDDLYHVAYLVFVDENTAEKFVTAICLSGVHKYSYMEDEEKIRFRLTGDLYRRIKRRLWFWTPDKSALPTPLQALNKHERLLVAMRFSSGLSLAEAGRIAGLSPEQYRNVISDIMCKVPLTR